MDNFPYNREEIIKAGLNALEQHAYAWLTRAQAYANAQSNCCDKKVAVMLFAHKNVPDIFYEVARGHNGMRLCDIQGCAVEKGQRCISTHAEIRALISMQPYNTPWLCISTLEPCYDCAKALAIAGVQMVVFAQHTNPAKSGKEYWQEFVHKDMWIYKSIRSDQ